MKQVLINRLVRIQKFWLNFDCVFKLKVGQIAWFVGENLPHFLFDAENLPHHLLDC